MPEIQLLSVLAAAPPAPNSTAGVQYGDANGNANTNTNAADHPRDSFLDQLKSALATVASVALPHKIAPVVDDQPNLPLPPSQDQPEQPKPVSEGDMMAEVLTALGLMLVPTPPQPPAAPKSESMTSGDHAAATASLLATLVDNQPQPPHDSSTTPTPTPPANPAPVEAQAAPLQPVPAPAPHVAEAKPAIDPAKVQLTSTDPAPAAPIATAATANANMIVPGPNAAAKEASSPQPAPVASAAPSVPTSTTIQVSAGQSNSQHSGEHDGSDSHAKHLVETAESAPTEKLPVADQAFMSAAAAKLEGTQPAHVGPSEVVNQIAHQAELYRLPGNRGVRIQLHPEDLGGVDVTLRYSAAGGIQMHINVEHAATGSLVQAGWTQLRDALATQGINPDRLVVSISAPGSASQLDLSNRGDSRPDPGLAAFSQGQSGRQRQDAQDQPVVGGWRGVLEPIAPEDLQREALTAGSSHIDYRV
jgi:flagellar hook-length control protein FliK